MSSDKQFEADRQAGIKIAEAYNESEEFNRGFGEGFAIALSAMKETEKYAGTGD